MFGLPKAHFAASMLVLVMLAAVGYASAISRDAHREPYQRLNALEARLDILEGVNVRPD